MTKEIKQYEPMIVVSLKNGRKLLTPAVNRKAVEDRWIKKLPTRIEGVTVDAFLIETIEDLSPENDIFIGLTEDQRNKANERFQKYYQALGKQPDRITKKNMILKILNNL